MLTRSHAHMFTQVFCMSGGGNHSSGIRNGLLARGWMENEDHNSVHFDFKWAIGGCHGDKQVQLHGPPCRHRNRVTEAWADGVIAVCVGKWCSIN